MTCGLVGGFLLIVGAYLTYIGKIYWAVLIYFLADICWVIISVSNGDIAGSIMTSIGMLLGLLSFIKMNNGTLRKNLEW
jgi:hypothetical protein